MKKMMIAVAFIASAATVNAQKLQLIPKAGVSIATQNIEGVKGEKMKTDFTGGVALNIPTGSGKFSVQPEINIVGKGTSVKLAGKKTNLNSLYLEMPVLAKYSFGPVFINAGPSIGVLLEQSNRAKLAYGKTKEVDFGVQMGAGVALPVGPGKVVVEGRYSLGLNDISDVKGREIKNRGILATVGYAFTL